MSTCQHCEGNGYYVKTKSFTQTYPCYACNPILKGDPMNEDTKMMVAQMHDLIERAERLGYMKAINDLMERMKGSRGLTQEELVAFIEQAREIKAL